MMTLVAPKIINRRKERSPILVSLPKRCLPPVECWRGVSNRPTREVIILRSGAGDCGGQGSRGGLAGRERRCGAPGRGKRKGGAAARLA